MNHRLSIILALLIYAATIALAVYLAMYAKAHYEAVSSKGVAFHTCPWSCDPVHRAKFYEHDYTYLV